jgi:hypothetical protein
MGSALLPPFLYYFESGKRTPLYLVFGILLITREDFSMLLAFVGIFLMIAHRNNRKNFKLAAFISIVSAFFFILVMNVIIPLLETETIKFTLFNYSALGQNAESAFVFLVKHPLESLRLLFVNHSGNADNNWLKTKYYLVFAASGGLLLFLRPAYLIILIPVITKKMYNDDPLRWTHEIYYGVETASILPALIFMIISEFKSARLKNAISMLVLIFSLATTVFCFRISDYPSSFTKFKFYKSLFYQHEYPTRQLNEMMQHIPANAIVSASGRILPHLANRQKIYYFPIIKDADYICISLSGDTWPVSPQEYNNELHNLIIRKEWSIILCTGNFALLKKNPNK